MHGIVCNFDLCCCIFLIEIGYSCNLTSGSGKSDNDAATVRANHPIFPSCGIFYFEVQIISKGRDGFAKIGEFTLLVYILGISELGFAPV